MGEVGQFLFRSLALERVAQRLAQDIAGERGLREIVLGARSHRAKSKLLIIERPEGYERQLALRAAELLDRRQPAAGRPVEIHHSCSEGRLGQEAQRAPAR